MPESPPRREFPLKQIGSVIANLYARLQPRRSADAEAALSALHEQDEAKTQMLSPRDTILTLDDLPITNTITRRWPLAKLDYPTLARTEDTSTMPPLLQSPLPATARHGTDMKQTPPENYTISSLAEDETEEMDALPGDSSEA